MQLALDAIEYGVIALDDEQRVAYANRRAEELLGRDGVALAAGDVRDVLGARDARWLDTEGEDRLGEPDAERSLRFEAGGREITLQSNPTDILDARGARIGTAVLLEEADESDPDFEQARKIDRLVSLGELSAYVAHEIRNPLTGIRTTVQFVGSKMRADDTRRADLEEVIAEIDRIEQIITSLLTFARPPASKPAPVQVADVVRRVLDNVDPQCTASSVVVEFAAAEPIPLVLADEDLLMQVFLNLVLNAVQAMPDGGSLAVTVIAKRTSRRRNMVEIAISDTGRGIPPENLQKIFAPFFTTRRTGTGLGLAISQQIVRECGGLITAANRPQGGALFRVTLPGLSARAAARVVAEAAPPEPAAAGSAS